jgi:hypothetical protein
VLLDEEAFDSFLNIAITDPVKRAKHREVWVNLASLYAELLKPLSDPEDANERTAKSLVVEDKAVLYVDSFTRATMLEAVPLYLHLTMSHLPTIVREHPVDISDLSQQYVENALKQGKMDMHVFSNNRLRDETNKQGRNLQVFKKQRERAKLKRAVPLPLNRNERRQLGDGSKAAEQTVARAGRRGKLVSRSAAQVEKKVEKAKPELMRICAAYNESQELPEDLPVEEAPAANSLIPSSSSSGLSQRPPAGGGAGAGTVAPGAADGAEGSEAEGAGAPGGRGSARPPAAPRGAGAAGAAGGRDSARPPAAARGGRGDAGRGRGRGGSRGSRARPASARDV